MFSLFSTFSHFSFSVYIIHARLTHDISFVNSHSYICAIFYAILEYVFFLHLYPFFLRSLDNFSQFTLLFPTTVIFFLAFTHSYLFSANTFCCQLALRTPLIFLVGEVTLGSIFVLLVYVVFFISVSTYIYALSIFAGWILV